MCPARGASFGREETKEIGESALSASRSLVYKNDYHDFRRININIDPYILPGGGNGLKPALPGDIELPANSDRGQYLRLIEPTTTLIFGTRSAVSFTVDGVWRSTTIRPVTSAWYRRVFFFAHSP